MRKALIMLFVVCLTLWLIPGCGKKEVPAPNIEPESFLTIGTGSITGVYYPTGGAIAHFVNNTIFERANPDVGPDVPADDPSRIIKYKVQIGAESSKGSVYNINAIMDGGFEFGIVQSDRQFQAVEGLAEWEGNPQKTLRAIFSIHPESVTLVTAVDAGIKSIADLKDKKVNIGNVGSGQRQNAIDALTAVGINYEKDLTAFSMEANACANLLQKGEIDAFFYTVGHPNGAVAEAVSGTRKAVIVPITGIDSLLKKYPYYAKAYIPTELYGASGIVNTFGVKATFVTSASTPAEMVYNIVKAIFDNFEAFKTMHPAYSVLTKEDMLEGLSAPLHPGAVKYYKEVGLM